ncbi:sodium:proton antiporter [Niastella yeongjuensis]|uniref:Sodium:proton antiporter n=1 Tax=Niastella yeongjuensis TaxID=354355 RepID=A0A1V9ET67_9BACT|nr:sodium:proton antiporter NhaD [Niastella yeongjuensis]OQP49357.1 sodium:proton antiporter [Niastella yeongjuensis]
MVTVILIIFLLGYMAIALEHVIRLNKAASALITGVLCWVVYMINTSNKHVVNEQLATHLGDIAGILFFLLGAMTIVELVDSYDGFEVITNRIKTTKKVNLLWLMGSLSFVLSAVLDNLTATIVMVSLVRKLIRNKQARLLFCGIMVITSNAGGACSPIGDVTTTMLWIGGQITSVKIIANVILPSIACAVIPMLVLSFRMRGAVEVGGTEEAKTIKPQTPVRERNIVFVSGILILLLVPVFKTFTHLPPFMGMLMGLGIMWVITEILHHRKDMQDKHFLSVLHALRKIDTPSILFFLGILISVAALQSVGALMNMATQLNEHIGNATIIVSMIGVLSSIVDNVPLVAASMGMYGLDRYPTDHFFWHFLAYCAGTGGSLLVIGSAAGVAAMGIEKIEFFWYMRKIAWLALLGYLAGIGVFLLQQAII